MPFELKVGLTRLQRFVNSVLQGLIKSGNMVVYMEDIL